MKKIDKRTANAKKQAEKILIRRRITREKDIGKKFGRWKIIGTTESCSKVVCKCKCGTVKKVFFHNLKYGNTKSCGCLTIDTSNYYHKIDHRFYQIWTNMKQRIFNKKVNAYKYYGGRGLKIVKKWNSFNSFKNDMYESYLDHVKNFGDKQTTIERVNNDKGYSKSNCKWATRSEQAKNRRGVK